MELKVTSLDGKASGSVTVSDTIFGLEPRNDIIHRCVVWQLAKRQAGTHQVKNRADIHRTGKKMYRQKGTGNARHGSARVPQFRGGGRAFGPHAYGEVVAAGKHGGEDLVAVAVRTVEGVGVAITALQLDQTAGLARRNGPQQKLIYKAEGCCVDADAQRQRSYRN